MSIRTDFPAALILAIAFVAGPRFTWSDETKVVTKSIVQMFLDEIVRELSEGNRLEFRDFGVFEVRERRARLGGC